MFRKLELDKRLKGKAHEIVADPIIIRVNKFNEESLEKFSASFNTALEMSQSVIPIVIDSYGGQVYSLMSMVEMILSSPVPVATFVSGKAMSCGAMLFCFGTEGLRFIGEHSTLMFHDVSSFAAGKIEELKADVKEADRLNEKIFRMAAKHIGKNETFFIDMIDKNKHADVYIDPQRALKQNIANMIGTPEFSTKVVVEENIVFNGKKLT